ncbi:MAG: Arginine N-succinyltransferase [Burkholderia gladioli]|nr:MAG: Arginine N-succinyltransferase [Burkholderia gladioli]
MIVVRVVQTGDVDALVALAQETGPGLTTFKPDRDALAACIERARRTLDGTASPAEAGYFFVMEDTASGDIAGVCGIETEVGLAQPFYNYRVATVVHASQDLGVWTRMSLLNISHDLTGYAEVCSLFLSPRRAIARPVWAGCCRARASCSSRSFANAFPSGSAPSCAAISTKPAPRRSGARSARTSIRSTSTPPIT